eukprot:TRINITY_DN19490_c0_g1_i5.p1 TRINITY_DN19490_c0_g1~~TRINITY_DN19490_c0_g1_i5.p1  ORF type:complete len:157 (+),score=30.27 TRINITY_DN19490_c0_g1_i5:59-529(+)
MLLTISSYWRPNNEAKAKDWRTLEIHISPQATIADTKKVVQRETGVAVDAQHFYFGGRTLGEEEIMSDAVGADCKINLVVRMKEYYGSPGSPESRFSPEKRPSRVSHNFLTQDFTGKPLDRKKNPVLHRPIAPGHHSPSRLLSPPQASPNDRISYV